MKLTTKQIAMTAALLAICIISQFLKNTSVFITGPIVNACIILAGLCAGLVCGIILSVITPVTAYLITGAPIMSAIPAIMPCIMIGNALLVICVCLFKNKVKGSAGLPVSMAVGCIVKALFMGIVISLILLPAFLPEKMQPMMGKLKNTYSLVQLITAVIGSIYAYIIWIPLKKYLKNEA